jgi:co-chaperonin GroES (HSP10)
MKNVETIVGIKPVGSQVLVEVLTKQEQFNTKLILSDNTENTNCPQAYILAIGPGTLKNVQDYGFAVGDRVLITGNFTPVPNYEEGRQKALIEPTCIKGILIED